MGRNSTHDVAVLDDVDLKPTLSHDEKGEIPVPRTEAQMWLDGLSDDEFASEQKKLLRKVRLHSLTHHFFAGRARYTSAELRSTRAFCRRSSYS